MGGGESSGWYGHPRVFLFYVNTMYTTLGARRELRASAMARFYVIILCILCIMLGTCLVRHDFFGLLFC